MCHSVLCHSLALWFGMLSAVYADSATWNLNPTNDHWNRAVNWTPATVPDDSNDVATFDLSNTTAISLSATTRVDSIVFNPGASAYTIRAAFDLNLDGLGIINNSGVTQSFIVSQGPGNINFQNSATAGDAHFRTGPSGGVSPGSRFTTPQVPLTQPLSTVVDFFQELRSFTIRRRQAMQRLPTIPETLTALSLSS